MRSCRRSRNKRCDLPVAAPDVFINCPFDDAFRPLFESILFTITASGYIARCALEEENGADIRLDKLCKIIEQCPRSIHDLSRIPLNGGELPRFNMPFELGLTIGAKKFGPKSFRDRSAVIMVKEPYILPAYLSDLGGNDPHAHHDEVRSVIRIVRSYLSKGPSGAPLPGPAMLESHLIRFQTQLPIMAAKEGIAQDELDAFGAYKDYEYFLSAYLKEYPVV
jgi:hypothetical protein